MDGVVGRRDLVVVLLEGCFDSLALDSPVIGRIEPLEAENNSSNGGHGRGPVMELDLASRAVLIDSLLDGIEELLFGIVKGVGSVRGTLVVVADLLGLVRCAQSDRCFVRIHFLFAVECLRRFDSIVPALFECRSLCIIEVIFNNATAKSKGKAISIRFLFLRHVNTKNQWVEYDLKC